MDREADWRKISFLFEEIRSGAGVPSDRLGGSSSEPGDVPEFVQEALIADVQEARNKALRILERGRTLAKIQIAVAALLVLILGAYFASGAHEQEGRQRGRSKPPRSTQRLR